jgi:hypothetical protein
MRKMLHHVFRSLVLPFLTVLACYFIVAWSVGTKGAWYVLVITLGVTFGNLFGSLLGKEIEGFRSGRRLERHEERHRQLEAFLALPEDQRAQARRENWYPKAFPDRRSKRLDEAEEDIVSNGVEFNVLLLAELRGIAETLGEVAYHVSGPAKRDGEETDAFLKEMRKDAEESERKWQALPESEKRSRLEANLAQSATKGDDGVWRSKKDGTIIELNEDGTVVRRKINESHDVS